jgi:rhomboid protease GluP
MGNIGAILCPNCGRLINATAAQCIHCGYKNPGRKGISSFFKILDQGSIDIIKIITVFCITLFILSLIIDPSAILEIRSVLDILSPSTEALNRLGMTSIIAMIHKKWWTVITAIYLHGGLLHILFNLLWIRQLGPMIEQLFGRSRFIIIFTISGILGFVLSNSIGLVLFLLQLSRSAYSTIGASGSIFGLLGALVFYGKHRGGSFGESISKQFLTYAIVIFIMGFLMSGINNWAHAGGFIGGYLTAMLLRYNENKPETAFHRNLAALAIIVTIISFIMVIINP